MAKENTCKREAVTTTRKRITEAKKTVEEKWKSNIKNLAKAISSHVDTIHTLLKV